MTYQQSLEKIHSLLHLGSRPGLDRMLKLLDTALDVKNKGKNMNLTASANCVRSFLTFNAAL